MLMWIHGRVEALYALIDMAYRDKQVKKFCLNMLQECNN